MKVVRRVTLRWPIAGLMAALAMSFQSPWLNADDCHCHSLPMFPAGGGQWWYISGIVISGGSGPCPANDMTVGYVKAPACHINYGPYPMCGPGSTTPCQHCPEPGADCTLVAQAAAEEAEQATDEPVAAQADKQQNEIRTGPPLPRTESTPFEGDLGQKLKVIGPVRASFLKIVSDDKKFRWAKLNAVTLQETDNPNAVPFTIHSGFEIGRPQGQVKTVNESDLTRPNIENGPEAADGWDFRLYTFDNNTPNDPKDDIVYAIRLER